MSLVHVQPTVHVIIMVIILKCYEKIIVLTPQNDHQLRMGCCDLSGIAWVCW